MKNKKLKIIAIIIAVCLSFFVLLNITWVTWRHSTYQQYINSCQKMEAASVLVPRYYHEDEEGYSFSVKYPDYLSLNGNLAVGVPSEDDNPWVDSLIIWINGENKYEYGVVLYDDDGAGGYIQNQIYINPDGTAINKEDESVLENHRKNVDNLLSKAKAFWNLK